MSVDIVTLRTEDRPVENPALLQEVPSISVFGLWCAMRAPRFAALTFRLVRRYVRY